MTSIPNLRACCVHHAGCDPCQGYLPRYLCFNAQVFWNGTGSGTGSGSGSTEPCCTEINARLFPGIGECGWGASGLACSDGSGAFGDILVEVVRIGTGSGSGTAECITRVTASILDEPIEFSGILQGVSFTAVNGEVEFSVQIGTGNFVPNPSAYEKCAPCTCVTCLPGSLCVRLITDDEYIAVADWDCESKSWLINGGGTGTGSGTGGMDISLRLATADDDVGCAIIGHISGAGVDQEFLISLETDSVPGPSIRGVSCSEGGGFLTVGKSELQPHTLNTTAVASFVLLEGTGSDPVGSLFIADHSCGGDCAVCPIPVEQTCCPEYLLPEFITLSFEGGSAVFQNIDVASGLRIWSQISGTIPGQTTPWGISCTVVLGISQWAINRALDGPDVPLELISCDPFELLGDGWEVTA